MKPTTPRTPPDANDGQEAIITTPMVERAVGLLKNCAATYAVGVLTGSNGTGKSFALRALAGRYSKLGLPGIAHRYLCIPNEGVTRGVKDLLADMGIGGALVAQGQTAPLALLCKHGLREFQNRHLRALLLDDADHWDLSALSGLIALYNYCHEHGHRISMILAGARPVSDWIGALPEAISRTVQIETSEPLDKPTMMSVLQEWGAPFSALARMVERGDAEAAKTMGIIYRITGGNLRQMRFFSNLLMARVGNGEITPEIMKDVSAAIWTQK